MRNSKILFWLSFVLLILIVIYSSIRVISSINGKSETGYLKTIKFDPDTKIINHNKVITLLNFTDSNGHFKKNIAIAKLNLKNLSEKLQTIPEVENISIQRKPNNQLKIHIIEREAIAFWLTNNIFYPIDKNGNLIDNPQTNIDTSSTNIFIGNQPSNIQSIINIINKNAILHENIDKIEHIENRRWNLILKNGLVIKLPESNIDDALNKLTIMQKRNMIIDRDIKTIDLRDPDRIIIR